MISLVPRVCPLVNAICNPLIMFSRSKAFRDKGRSISSAITDRLSRTTPAEGKGGSEGGSHVVANRMDSLNSAADSYA